MKAIDLYCGAGGLSLGFTQEGYKIVKAIDIDPVAVETFNRNIANVAECKDIRGVNLEELPDVDGIIGGPPCQAFSIAGRRIEKLVKIHKKLVPKYFPREKIAREDPRSYLSNIFVQIIRQKNPDWFVMENVDGLLKLSVRKTLEYFLSEKARYFLEGPLILNAVNYGVPQFRKRLFFIGFREGKKSVLFPSGLSRHEWKTVRQALPNYECEWYYRHPRTYGRRAVYSIDEPSPTIRTVNRPMPPNYKRHPGDAPYIEGQVRALTPEERAILQSFPSDFSWPSGSKTEKEKLIGDAVPPKLARVVARAIKESTQVWL
jgi:DNA (cytosine-5)-methyltransferase 1